jgi:hypothetical protein
MMTWDDWKPLIDEQDGYERIKRTPCVYCKHVAPQGESVIALGKQPPYRGCVCMRCYWNALDPRVIVYANNR